MIKRFWRGWTAEANAYVYEKLRRETIWPEIKVGGIKSGLGAEIWRCNVGRGEIDFVAEDYKQADIPGLAQELLLRWDERIRHYL